MKMLSKVLVLALCVTAMAFGALIDDFSVGVNLNDSSIGGVVSPDVARALSRAQFLRVRHFSVSSAANFDGGTYSPDLSGPPG